MKNTEKIKQTFKDTINSISKKKKELTKKLNDSDDDVYENYLKTKIENLNEISKSFKAIIKNKSFDFIVESKKLEFLIYLINDQINEFESYHQQLEDSIETFGISTITTPLASLQLKIKTDICLDSLEFLKGLINEE